jgi:hypothetical protein
MNTPDPVIDESGAEPPEDAAAKTEVTSDLPETETAPPDRPVPAPVPDAHAIADRLRAEFSEIATVAAQAARLGIAIDAADALRRGLKPDALRQTILETLAVRSEAADGVALFHANHKNFAGTGTALDVANLGKGRAAMARQTGLDGKTVLNIRPAFLVVPSSLELTAEQLIAQNLVPATAANVVPASIRSLSTIAEPRLDPAWGAARISPPRGCGPPVRRRSGRRGTRSADPLL